MAGVKCLLLHPADAGRVWHFDHLCECKDDQTAALSLKRGSDQHLVIPLTLPAVLLACGNHKVLKNIFLCLADWPFRKGLEKAESRRCLGNQVRVEFLVCLDTM